jgi:hypothetical protein
MNNMRNEDGWGGRIRTLEWRDQNPLPYHLATPQKFEHINNTLFFGFLSLGFLIFLSFTLNKAAAQLPPSLSILELNKRRVVSANLSPLTAILATDEQLIYSLNSRIFVDESSLPTINLLDENESFKVNRIYQNATDVYFATNVGLIRNQQRIFTKTGVNDLSFTKDKIYLSTDLGLYASDISVLRWELVTKANLRILQCKPSLKSKSLFYLLTVNGFYTFNSKKNLVVKVNQGLVFNSDSELKGRLEVLKHKQLKEELIYLALNNAVYKLDAAKKNWRRLTDKGLVFDQDSQMQVVDIFHKDDYLFLVASTGLFYAKLGLGNEVTEWHKVSSAEFNLDENFLEGFTASSVSTQDRSLSLFIGNFRGDLYQLRLGDAEQKLENGDGEQSHVALAQPVVFQSVVGKDLEVNKNIEANKTQEENTQDSINFDLKPRELDLKEKLKLIFSLEPTIQETQAKALQFSGIPSGMQFGAYKRQARLRNVLPQIDTSFDNSDYALSSLETRGSDQYDSADSSINSSLDKNRKAAMDNEFNTGFRFTWHLDRLIYDPEIIDIVNSARVSANIRENLLTELTQIYFQRKNLLSELMSNPFSRTMTQKFKLQELTADIDARTGGWYSLALRSRFREAAQRNTVSDLKRILEELDINYENI